MVIRTRDDKDACVLPVARVLAHELSAAELRALSDDHFPAQVSDEPARKRPGKLMRLMQALRIARSA
jgi:hypothetical protein